ncbi:RNA polymerase sigma factor [Archangium primigenium]|uniref:RNA polymerase sigma factor n=1 Tax=[Archangium] primigenium TaxID=2792470 RepID=UPI00195679AE|nr:sigma-70 family RNA polymerase sigma factor [Archangium primigenium]MBM7115683.1 sigma-70 family RNA polymerase sigma factor [Archangium primigenium]
MPTQREPPDERDLHARALRKDPVILLDLLKAFAQKMQGFVLRDLNCGEEAAYDAVIDVLFAYVATPERYDPKRGALLVTYLTQAAKYRVRDQLRSTSARVERDKKWGGDVELGQRTAKDILENYVEASRAVDRLIAKGHLKSPKDIAALRLILSGESSTEVLARALGLDTSNEELMRRMVKRHRDRLMKILERFGKEDLDDPT